jgi:hypothetical protein
MIVLSLSGYPNTTAWSALESQIVHAMIVIIVAVVLSFFLLVVTMGMIIIIPISTVSGKSDSLPYY